MKTSKILSRLNIELNILILVFYAVLCITVLKNPSTDTSFYLWNIGIAAIISLVAVIFSFIIFCKRYNRFGSWPFLGIYGNGFVFAISVDIWIITYIQNSFIVEKDFYYALIAGTIAAIINTILTIILAIKLIKY